MHEYWHIEVPLDPSNSADVIDVSMGEPNRCEVQLARANYFGERVTIVSWVDENSVAVRI